MKRIKKNSWFFLLFFLLLSCSGSKLPNIRYYQYSFEPSYQVVDGELVILLDNPLASPLRIWIQSDQDEIKEVVDSSQPVTLAAFGDTLIRIPFSLPDPPELSFASRLGDLNKTVKPQPLALPFPKNKKYYIIQGINSTPTHNTDYSRYAVDFSHAVGDTVSAAADGFVVGIIDQYRYGGEGQEWRPFSNFITLYHPEYGIFTQYAHLKINGVLVRMGEEIKQGQPIGLAGLTGQTNIEHLHFNALVPTKSEAGLASFPIDFVGYPVQQLRRGDWVEH